MIYLLCPHDGDASAQCQAQENGDLHPIIETLRMRFPKAIKRRSQSEARGLVLQDNCEEEESILNRLPPPSGAAPVRPPGGSADQDSRPGIAMHFPLPRWDGLR
jgi:hypothetical protein